MASTVVGDEFERLADRALLVYDLQGAGAHTATPLGLILVSTQELAALDLDARNRGRLGYRTV